MPLSTAERAALITQDKWNDSESRRKIEAWLNASPDNAKAGYEHLLTQPWYGNTKLAWALRYVRKGLAVFPCYYVKNGGCSCGNKDCGSPGKHPRARRGLHDATKDEERVRKWWEAHPDDNIGIATGSSSGAVVLDVDAERGGNESLESLLRSNGEFPPTWECITGGGGKHLWFVAPAYPVRNTVNLARGIDVRGDGGYVLAPPSTHLSGRTYEWEASGHPDDIPLAEAPPWLFRVREESKVALGEGIPIPDGQRHDQLFRLASSMRARGSAYESIRTALLVENETRCQPPLSLAEVSYLAKDVVDRYPPGTPLSEFKPLGYTKALEIRQIGELMREKYPPMVWYVNGLIQAGVAVLAGRPKTGKSLMCLQLGLAIAGGGTFLLRTTEPRRVVYCPLEDGLSRVQDRSKRHGYSQEILDRMNLYIVPEIPDIASTQGLDTLRQLAKMADLVIIDTISTATTMVDWNDGKAVSKLYKQIWGIHADLGASFLFTDHRPKSNKDGTRDPVEEVLGSIVKTAKASCVLLLHREEGGQCKLLLRSRDAAEDELKITLDEKTLQWNLA